MILLCHHISPLERGQKWSEHPVEWGSVLTPQQFRSELIELLRLGFRFVPFSKLVSTISRRGWEPWRTVALTFDDGWEDNYTHALPVLEELKVPAMFFVTTAHIHSAKADPSRMSVLQLKDMLQRGMEVGAHTRNHPNLLTIPLSAAANEIAGSKADLETKLGVRIDYFAYPYGAHHEAQASLVQAAGFSAAVSAGRGAQNTKLGLFWLFRYGLNAKMAGTERQEFLKPLPATVRGLYWDLRKKVGWPIRAIMNSRNPKRKRP